MFKCRNTWALLHHLLVDTECFFVFSFVALWTSRFNLHVPCFPALHEQTQAGLLCVTSGPYIPTAAISITIQCLAHCQLLLGSQPAPRSPVLFFFSGRKQQPIVRGGAGRRDRGGKLMKLFDGSPGHGARGEAKWTSAWQWDGWGAREKRGKGERNREENGDGSSVGGRCQKGVITWRQTDSIVNPEPEAALQYHAQGADIGLGTDSHGQEAHRREAQSPRDAHLFLSCVFTSQDDLPETECSWCHCDCEILTDKRLKCKLGIVGWTAPVDTVLWLFVIEPSAWRNKKLTHWIRLLNNSLGSVT